MKLSTFCFVAAFVAFSLIACRSPESDYQAIKQNVDRGEFNSTLAECDTALRRYGGRDDGWEWRFRLLKARILVSRSQGEEAFSVLGPEPPATLASTDIPEQRRLFQGIAHRYTQKFSDAEHDFAETEKLAASLAPRYTCQLLLARGALWVDEKKYESAEQDYRRSLALAHENQLRPQEASALADLARLSTAQNHFDEALDLYLVALQRAQELEMKGNVAVILGNMGWSYFELGDFERALEFYKNGAEQSERSGLNGYSAYWFTGVANTSLALRDYSSAEELAKKTLKRARDLNNAQTIAICLNTLAEIALETGRLDEAEQHNKEALDLEEAGADHFSVLESVLLSGRIAAKKENFAEAENLLRRVIQDKTAETAVRWKAEARLAEVHDEENRPAEAEREYRQSLDTIQSVRSSIERDDLRLSFLSGGIEFYDSYIDFLMRRKRPADALRVAELSRARTLEEGLASGGSSSAPASHGLEPQEFAKRLKAVLLFYWIGHNHSYLWAITSGKTEQFTLPKAAEIGPLVKSYQKTILGLHDAQGAGASQGKQLYSMLIGPAEKLIPKGSRVFVLPAESLYGLNFETLIAPEPQPHFWIEDVTLTTASSLTLLEHSTKRPAAKAKSLLLIGDTVQPNADFPPLAQAPAEMKEIERYFPESQREVLEGKQATPSAYLSSNPERYAYLHFVTHGTASHTRPLESAVILSKEGDSYKLYARDIVTHHLNANLVTISACNGSGTRAYSGEGLVGLSWAFLRAGAHNVVGALWEVSDASTPQLMDALYSDLSQGKDPATALRDAKLKLLHSAEANSVFRKPFYWAPFQLYAGS